MEPSDRDELAARWSGKHPAAGCGSGLLDSAFAGEYEHAGVDADLGLIERGCHVRRGLRRITKLAELGLFASAAKSAENQLV
jgi:hypothetical protein